MSLGPTRKIVFVGSQKAKRLEIVKTVVDLGGVNGILRGRLRQYGVKNGANGRWFACSSIYEILQISLSDDMLTTNVMVMFTDGVMVDGFTECVLWYMVNGCG